MTRFALLLLTTTCTIVFAGPTIAIKSEFLFTFGVDVSANASVSQLQCVKQAGYSFVFVQIFNATGGGMIAENGQISLVNNRKVGLRYAVYATPNITGGTSGATQASIAISSVSILGPVPSTVWVKVTNPKKWHTDTKSNIAFIESWVNGVRNRGYSPGIFTNWYDWKLITGSTDRFAGLKLWYWHTYGDTARSETASNYDDFVPFANWTRPVGKQFTRNTRLCGLNVHSNVQVTNATTTTAPVQF